MARTVRIFVASPGDVHSERDALAALVSELDDALAVIAPEKDLRLEVVRWETHATPAAGIPQAVINADIGEYDIFIGIMWSRFGTPSGEADSGTQEEFARAYNRWEKTGRPHILFYFCQAPAPIPKSREQLDQLSRLIDFRDAAAKRALVSEYGEHADFRRVVRPHLLVAISRAIGVGPSLRKVDSVLPESERAALEAQVMRLVAEYQETRTNMPPGDPRTRRMELIATQMRTLALPGQALLGRFASSGTPGQYLVAAAFLQAVPRVDYLSWLGERVGERQPFLGYHAAVGLLASARSLPCSSRDAIAAAIADGQRRLRDAGVSDKTDRGRVLAMASSELTRRCGDANYALGA